MSDDPLSDVKHYFERTLPTQIRRVSDGLYEGDTTKIREGITTTYKPVVATAWHVHPVGWFVGDEGAQAIIFGDERPWKEIGIDTANNGLIPYLASRYAPIFNRLRVTDLVSVTESKQLEGFIRKVHDGLPPRYTVEQFNTALESALNQYDNTTGFNDAKSLCIVDHWTKEDIRKNWKIHTTITRQQIHEWWKKHHSDEPYAPMTAHFAYCKYLIDEHKTGHALVDDEGYVLTMAMPVPDGCKKAPVPTQPVHSTDQSLTTPESSKPTGERNAPENMLSSAAKFLDENKSIVLAGGLLTVAAGLLSGGFALPVVGGLIVAAGWFGKDIVASAQDATNASEVAVMAQPECQGQDMTCRNRPAYNTPNGLCSDSLKPFLAQLPPIHKSVTTGLQRSI